MKQRVTFHGTVLAYQKEYDNVATPIIAYWRLKTKANFTLLELKVVAFASERWSFTRDYKYGDLTWKLLVIWKTDR